MNTEELLKNSRLTPVSNGDPDCPCIDAAPTSAHKWWASIMLGIIFLLLSNPLTVGTFDKFAHMKWNYKQKKIDKSTFVSCLIRTLLFIIIVRVILW